MPVLIEIFSREGFAKEHLVPLAIGTSAATIVFTGISSARAHHAKEGVMWSIVVAMAPGIVVGSLVGPQIASALPPALMAAAFGAFIWFGAYRMLRNKPPVASRRLPGRLGMAGMGALIGMIAGMVGTGGAFLAVPFMTRCNVRLHVAVGTSAAMSIPVAIFATLGFVIAGWNKTGLPAYAVGYVYLPALIGIAITSTLFAPMGARMAHRWPVDRLRYAFSAMLFSLGAYMWWKAWRLA